MPWVLDPEEGRLIVTAHGKRHVITCGADPISQRAAIADDVSELQKVIIRKPTGAGISLLWGRAPKCGSNGNRGSPGRGEAMWPFFDLLVPHGSPCPTASMTLVTRLRRLQPACDDHAWIGSAAARPGRRQTRPGRSGSRTSRRPPTGTNNATWNGLIGAYITHDRDRQVRPAGVGLPRRVRRPVRVGKAYQGADRRRPETAPAVRNWSRTAASTPTGSPPAGRACGGTPSPVTAGRLGPDRRGALQPAPGGDGRS